MLKIAKLKKNLKMCNFLFHLVENHLIALIISNWIFFSPLMLIPSHNCHWYTRLLLIYFSSYFYIFKFQMKIILWSYLALECCLNIISMECDVCCCFFHIAKIWLENVCKYFQSCMSETFFKGCNLTWKWTKFFRCFWEKKK